MLAPGKACPLLPDVLLEPQAGNFKEYADKIIVVHSGGSSGHKWGGGHLCNSLHAGAGEACAQPWH